MGCPRNRASPALAGGLCGEQAQGCSETGGRCDKSPIKGGCPQKGVAMAELRDFLANLATDPRKLGEFIHDPEAAMTAAELSQDDKAALRSGFPALIHARLSG